MERRRLVDRVERIAAVDVAVAGRGTLEAAARDVARLRSWLDEREGAITAALTRLASFPEKALADATRRTLREAERVVERAAALEALPAFARSLARGAITASHVDAMQRALRSLEPRERAALAADAERLVAHAEQEAPDRFAARLRREIEALRTGSGMDRLERQKRATRLRTWIGRDGMYRVSGAFDPESGVAIAQGLQATVDARFRERPPATAPSDPVERQDHLRALALVALVQGNGASGGSDIVAVIDADAPPVDQGASVEWAIPVEIPAEVLAELAGWTRIWPVVVRGGVVLHAPGQLDLGRTTRVANRPQRRALRAWYATCAVPGCQVHYDRCRIHHVIWWRHGGRTDLDNLLPVCEHHHQRIHLGGWDLALADDRTLTIRFPDGQVHTTGPPRRRAA